MFSEIFLFVENIDENINENINDKLVVAQYCQLPSHFWSFFPAQTLTVFLIILQNIARDSSKMERFVKIVNGF